MQEALPSVCVAFLHVLLSLPLSGLIAEQFINSHFLMLCLTLRLALRRRPNDEIKIYAHRTAHHELGAVAKALSGRHDPHTLTSGLQSMAPVG